MKNQHPLLRVFLFVSRAKFYEATTICIFSTFNRFYYCRLGCYRFDIFCLVSSTFAYGRGVTQIFLLLLVVDVCLGPLLTLVVYKKGKKTLKMDLAVIAILQISALVYGVHAVAEGRPAWLVYSVDRFEVVRVLDVDARELNKAKVEYRSPSWLKPQWVAVKTPENIEEKNTIMFEALAGGSDIAQHPYLYQQLTAQKEIIQKQLRKVNELTLYNSPEMVTEVLEQQSSIDGWLPLQAKNKDMVVLVDMNNLEHPVIVDLRPW